MGAKPSCLVTHCCKLEPRTRPTTVIDSGVRLNQRRRTNAINVSTSLGKKTSPPTGTVVSPTEATDLPGERKLMEIIICDAEVAGVKLSPVRWDDGVVALVPGDPADLPAWRQAVIKMHRAAVAGAIGPVHIGDQQ